MKFFKNYNKEFSSILLISFFQGFILDFFIIHAQPISYKPIVFQNVYYDIGKEGDQNKNDLIEFDKSTIGKEEMTIAYKTEKENKQEENENKVGYGSYREDKHEEDINVTTTSKSVMLYPADITFGVIGVNGQISFDNPDDNLFKIEIKQGIDFNASYALSYEVYGISNVSGVAKSINTATSTGGFYQNKKEEWSRITEFVSPHNLKKGVNTILFTSDLKSDSGYLVRNVQLEKIINDKLEFLKVNDVAKNSERGEIFVSGIISLDDADVKLYISGEEVAFQNYNFEHLVSLKNKKNNDIIIELIKEKVVIATQSFSVNSMKEVVNSKPFDCAFTKFEYDIPYTEEVIYKQGNVALAFPPESYFKNFTLSIQELRESDYAPLGMEIQNLTANNSAYRFLPDGIKFDKEIQVKIKYDLKYLPKGYSAKDIQVFYFDIDVKQWAKVKVVEILEDTNEIVAVTNHFTDYIAGIIQEPESPETNAFAPTTVSGIQVANPTENIPMVSVPQINDRGDAVLSLPLFLPSGRQGMTPDLFINYNSSADEGDFGLGWSLTVPYISVDTRWGVPTYDSEKETESYLFNGEELLLVKSDKTMYAPHKDALISRLPSASFQKAQHDPSVYITRSGSRVHNYSWEVMDTKTGWIYNYSLYSKGKWYLTSVRDEFNNSMSYFYNRNESGDYQLQKIEYNDHPSFIKGRLHLFTIEIIRKNTIDIPLSARQDIKTNNRFGVETKSVELIDKIIIRTEPKASYGVDWIELGSVYNEYNFIYKKGQFGRSLLHKIVNRNYNNDYYPFANSSATPSIQEYIFDYYDDIANGIIFESNGQNITTFNDYKTDYDSFGVHVSALGGSEGKSSGFGGGASAGMVLPFSLSSWLPFSRSATIGGNLGGGSSNSETKVMMVDIDGDGLPDKIFKRGNEFYYRKNTGNEFSYEVYQIENLPNLNYTKTNSSDKSFTVNILAGSFTKSFTKSTSTTYTYMADVNADGLLDIVNNERVYFGYIDPQTKRPSFNLDSSITPAIVLKEEDVAPILDPLPEIDITNGPMDMVMVWRAPKDGTVKVNGVINKQHIALQSGVKFSIEKLHETDMGNARFLLGPNLMLSSSETHDQTVNVVKGDLIFFRVHTNQIPLQELGVSWNPKVEYIGQNFDPIMSSSRHLSSYKQSFIVGTNYEQSFMKKGKYKLEWSPFNINDKDRITIKVSHFKKGSVAGGNIPANGNNIIIYEKTSSLDSSTLFSSPNIILDMNSITSDPSSFQYIKVEVLSDSEIDWKDIDNKFKPKLISLDNNNSDEYLIPYYSNYSRVHTNYAYSDFTNYPDNKFYIVNNNFVLPDCTEADCRDKYVYLVIRLANGSIASLVDSEGTLTGYLKFRYKINSNGRVIEKTQLNANQQYVPVSNTSRYGLGGAVGSKRFVEYYTTDYTIAEKLNRYQNTGNNYLVSVEGEIVKSNYVVGGDNTGMFKANIFSAEKSSAWGTMFRNWGQFAYKGAEVGKPYTPIIGKHIHMYNQYLTDNSQQISGDIFEDTNLTLEDVENNVDELENLSGGMTEYFSMLLPNKKQNRWESHEHLYVSDSQISPYTRFLTDEIPDLMPPTVPVNNFGAYGINKYSHFNNNSTNKSFGFLAVNVGSTKTKGSSDILNEFMDVNGDGYPDIIGKKIQITGKRGGLSSKIVDTDLNISTSITGSGSLLGGSSTGIKGSPPLSNNNKNLNLIVGNQASASLGSSSFTTMNLTSRFYVDINGDGLVDIVQNNGKVFLNYGGTFILSALWSSLPFQKTKTTTENGGAGLGFSAISNMDLSLGVSLSSSTSKDLVTYMDLNGDGLPEKIVDGTKYYINLGTRFDTTAKNLPGIQSQKSTEAGLNGNITICIYFPSILLIGPKFCVSINGNGGRSISSEESRFMDFDGDGFPDYVTSNRDESITVYSSRIKRTNLLKKITQSTGATVELDYNVINPIDKSVIGSSYKMPYKKWALTEVSVFDDFVGDGEDIIRYKYEYFNGYKDRKERNFLGFGMVKSHLLDKDGWPYRTEVIEYLNNDMTENDLYRPGTSSDLKQYIYKKGLPQKIYTLDRYKRLLNETVYAYKFYDYKKIIGDINTSTTSNAEVSVFTEKLSVLPLVTRIKNKIVNYDEDTDNNYFEHVTEQQFNLYDQRGNVKKYLDLNRRITVDIEYSLGIKTLPLKHRVSNTVNNQTLRLTEAFTNDGLKIHKVNRYFGTNYVSTSYEYDHMGNLIEKILPDGSNYRYDYGVFDDRATDYQGSYFKIVPTKIQDPFGNTVKIFTNPYGLPVKLIDVYGVELMYKYDHFNRLLEYKGPYEEDWTIKNKYINNRAAITQHNLGEGNILYTSMINDGLGRTLQTKKQMRINDETPEYNDNHNVYHLAVSGKNIYDEFGRVVENYLSDEEFSRTLISSGNTLETTLTNYYNVSTQTERKTGRIFDNKDRVTEELVYGTNAMIKNKYAFGADRDGLIRFTQETTLPEGNKTIIYTDNLGQTISQKQIGEGENLWTSYKYDNLGQVKEVKNAMEHLYKYEYDLLGRILKKNSSASGIVEFEYDVLGQIIKKQDANNNIINYKYDFNRLVEVINPTINSKFTYDLGGRLIKMEDNSGYHKYKYGKLGEVIEETKMIYNISDDPLFFKTEYKYDSWGRILEMIYPDLEKVLYEYNTVGQLTGVKNGENYYYLKDVKYNHLDQPYYIKYGNNVELIQEFDITERLRASQLSAPNTNNSGQLNVFYRNVFAYNKNNNIIGVYNDFSQHDVLVVGGKYIKKYEYDSFNRLKYAEGSWKGLLEKHDYLLKMEYLKDHSILYKNQTHVISDLNSGEIHHSENSLKRNYKYEDQTVPRVSAITGRDNENNTFDQHFKYMPNGSIELIKYSNAHSSSTYFKRDFKWDANNNIIHIIDNDGEVKNQYIYDGKGERVIKRTQSGSSISINGGEPLNGMHDIKEVLYPSGNMVYNGEIYTKHYYANGKRLASRISDSNDAEYFKNEFSNKNAVTNSEKVKPIKSKNEISAKNTAIKPDIKNPIPAEWFDFSKVSNQICENQVNILLNVLYNTPETLDCKNLILEIIERHKIYGLRCVEYASSAPVNPSNPLIDYFRCKRFENVFIRYDYCAALEEINTLGCIERTEDGRIINLETGYVYDPETGLPFDPITGLPIDLGTISSDEFNSLELDCYNKLLNFITRYKSKDNKPEEYYELIKYISCFSINCEHCIKLPGVEWDGKRCVVKFCDLDVPDIEEEMDEPEQLPNFPIIVLWPGTDETWTDNPPEATEIVANPQIQNEPVWWYHNDHLGSSSYITDVSGKPCQYIDYLPFGEVMVEQSTNNIFENRYKFNAKELDEATGYYYYSARYYDPNTSIWLSVDPLADADKNIGYSPYVYAVNNPITYTDPDGRCWQKVGDSYVPCDDASVGSTTTGAFGHSWTMTKNDGWQLTNGADPSTVNYEYDAIPASGDASYYVDRYKNHIEKYNTRPPDYYLVYGHKYINRFKNETRDKLTGLGKDWLDETAVALQKMMNQGISANPFIQGNNDAFQGFAYGTHVPAYSSSGKIGLLKGNDLWNIMWTPDIKDSFLSKDGVKQIMGMFPHILKSPRNPDLWDYKKNPGLLKPWEPKW